MEIREREGERAEEGAHAAESKRGTAMEGEIEKERGIKR